MRASPRTQAASRAPLPWQGFSLERRLCRRFCRQSRAPRGGAFSQQLRITALRILPDGFSTVGRVWANESGHGPSGPRRAEGSAHPATGFPRFGEVPTASADSPIPEVFPGFRRARRRHASFPGGTVTLQRFPHRWEPLFYGRAGRKAKDAERFTEGGGGHRRPVQDRCEWY